MSGAVFGKVAANPAVGAGEAASTQVSSVHEVPRRLRVLQIVESSAGGTGRHVLDLAEGLAQRDCDVHIIYSPRRADRLFLDRLPSLGLARFTALPMRTGIHPSDYGAVRAIRRHMREHGPFDVIHGHSSKGGALARLAGIGSGARTFYTLHGLIMMDPGLARWKRTVYLGIELGLSVVSAGIFAVSPEESRAAIHLGLGASRVAMIPNGVGAIRCTPRPIARRTLGVSDEHLLIGFIGRLVEQKAPRVLLEAFASVAKALPHARLVMVGDGPLRRAMEALTQALGVQEQVLWLGERDAREVLAALDVFAISSCKEGLPYVVLEAMSAGLPVVATASSGVEILIEPGRNGTIVPMNDAPAFARALLSLAQDEQLRRVMGQASLRQVRKFTVEAMVERTLEAYLKQRGA